MNIKKYFILACAISFALFACNKKDDDDIIITLPPTTANPSVQDYAKLDVGNYWIYERYNKDTNGIETALGIYDSSFVDRDTIINSMRYSILQLPAFHIPSGYETYILRDSLDYLIDHKGRILFALNNFNKIVHEFHSTFSPTDTVFSIYRQMKNKDSLVTVPAGMYKTYNSFETVDYKGPMAHLPNRERNMLFSKNVGIVYFTQAQFSSNPVDPIQKMVRYYVK